MRYPDLDFVPFWKSTNLFESFVWKQTILPGLVGFGFLVVSKFTRWFLKERQVDQFDQSDCHEMCKFCQIIKNEKTLSYLDDKVAVFDDSRPAAQYHLLMCPVEHIKSINTLKKEHKTLLEYMKSKALEIIQKKMDKKGEKFDEKLLKIGFHRVLSTSIDHLHMHVFILPFKNPWESYKKYNRYFFADFDEIIQRL